MWGYLRRKKDEFVKSFADDIIIATGRLPYQAEYIRCPTGQNITVSFECWVRQVYDEWSKLNPKLTFSSLPIIYGVISQHPALLMIAPGEYPFALMRFLTHPLAREYRNIIPWLYRDTVEALEQFILQDFSQLSRQEIYRQVESIKIFNSRLMRKNILDALVYQLREVETKRYLTYLPLSIDAVLGGLKKFKRGKYHGICLPLPSEKDLLYIAIIFWMQLLEIILRDKFHHWQIYWHQEKLLFYQGGLPAYEFIGLWYSEKFSAEIVDCFKENSIQSVFIPENISLIQLLSYLSEYLHHGSIH